LFDLSGYSTGKPNLGGGRQDPSPGGRMVESKLDHLEMSVLYRR